MSINLNLAGGFEYLLFSPRKVGKMNPFWRAYFFNWVGSTTNWKYKVIKVFDSFWGRWLVELPYHHRVFLEWTPSANVLQGYVAVLLDYSYWKIWMKICTCHSTHQTYPTPGEVGYTMSSGDLRVLNSRRAKRMELWCPFCSKGRMSYNYIAGLVGAWKGDGT